jgi:tetratricopeptide (TPR) repeat protein
MAVKDIILVIVAFILGVVLEEPGTKAWGQIRDWWRPERKLERVDSVRRRITEPDLRTATMQYRRLLDEPGITEPTKAKVYQGLSRTYSDWCYLNFRRGLASRDLALTAKDCAEKSGRIVSGAWETGIALAYAFFWLEADEKSKPQTAAQVAELQKTHADDFDVQYLTWLLDKKPSAFPKRLDAQQNPSLPPLIDVAQRLLAEASRKPQREEKAILWKTAESYLGTAENSFPGNPLILFFRGYLAQVSGDAASARDYYLKTLDKDPNFPRARDNLGVVYAINGQLDEARLQFEAAAATPNAPAQAQLFALGNLGETYWEQGRSDRACTTWANARILPGSEEDLPSLVHLALCAYGKDVQGCRRYYREAIKAGKTVGLDLRRVSTFEKEWHPGPNELSAIKGMLTNCGPS